MLNLHFLTWIHGMYRVNFTFTSVRLRLKCDGTRAETRFRLSAKSTSPFKLAGAPVQSTTGSRCVRISGSNAGYTKIRGSVKYTGYPHHLPVSPSLLLPCVDVCRFISNELKVCKIHNPPWTPQLNVKLKMRNLLTRSSYCSINSSKLTIYKHTQKYGLSPLLHVSTHLCLPQGGRV